MKLFSAILVASTVLSVATAFSNTDEKAAIQVENQVVSAAFDKLKVQMLATQTEALAKEETRENKHKLFELSSNLDKVTLLPSDEELKELKLTKPEGDDPKVWGEFYTALTKAYEEQATKAHESANQAFSRRQHTRNDYRVDAMRSNESHKTFGTQRSKGTDSSESFKSARHLPSETHRSAMSYHSRGYRESLAVEKSSRFKADFYGQLAGILNPQPEDSQESSQKSSK